MLIRLICACVICVGMYETGKEYSDYIRKKAELVGSYLFFASEMKSAVMFSGKNMYDFFEKFDRGRAGVFCRFAHSRQNAGMKRILDEYSASCKEEKECLKILAEALYTAESSSDASQIAASLDMCVHTFMRYKQQIEEENRAKVKTAPAVALMLGLFVAVLII